MLLLETERLTLHKLSADDAAFIMHLVNTPGWLRFIGDRGVRTLAEAGRYIENVALKKYEQFGFGSYLIRLKEGNIPIGTCGLFKRDFLEDVDLGYALLPEYAGNGYAVEASEAVMKYAQDNLGFRRILAITTPDNTRSLHLLKKLGFTIEKTQTIAGEELVQLAYDSTASPAV